jgi:hypothetical protein
VGGELFFHDHDHNFSTREERVLSVYC